jgi:tetratricopeptide (TPR) repeat protein
VIPLVRRKSFRDLAGDRAVTLAVLVVGVVVLAGCGGGDAADAAARAETGVEPRSAPPDPDTSAYEKPVAEKIATERQAVLAEPASVEAWGRLGMTFDAHHMIHEAAACYAQAERLAPDDWRWPYLQAIVSLDARPEEVLALLVRAHEHAADSALVNLRIGRELLRLDRAREAEPYFQRAHELDPEDPHALVGLGRVALASGDVARARVHLETAEDMRPRPREVFVLLARVYRELGEHEYAEDMAARATRSTRNTPIRDPIGQEIMAHGMSSFHMAMRGRERMRDGDWEGAIEELRASVATNPDDLEVRLDLVRALYMADRVPEARAEIEEASRLHPDSIDVEAELESLRRRASDE